MAQLVGDAIEMHSKCVFHRDIKGGNILVEIISHESTTVTLAVALLHEEDPTIVALVCYQASALALHLLISAIFHFMLDEAHFHSVFVSFSCVLFNLPLQNGARRKQNFSNYCMAAGSTAVSHGALLNLFN